jgi:uncharacterized C2H2 Zn-finger protein
MQNEKQQQQQNFRCPQCGKVLNSQEEFREHEKQHKGQSFQAGSAGQTGGQTRGAGGGQSGD